MKRAARGCALLMVAALITITLSGCSTQNVSAFSQATAVPTETVSAEGENASLDAVQRNSIAMLNYLAVLTQEINASQNSRLYLEQAYSRLIDNTYPNAVDSRTLVQLTSILDTLERYRMTAVKRERLTYVLEQNRGQSIRAAIPSPLGLISAVQSFSLPRLAMSIVYMTADSAASYTSTNSQSELEYLQDSWALDDEAAQALHESRKDTFIYMVRVVSDYNLPGELALSESAVDDFVAWKANENVAARIRFLESNADTYQMLGTYYLTLAESYYENGQYAQCLNSVQAYEDMECRIFRKDYDLARVLPLAVAAAKESLPRTEYARTAEHYISLLDANSDYDDWSAHYFIAQTYMDLYDCTGKKDYLNAAYEVLLDNVNSLANEQRALNAKYLAPLQNAEIPKDATKAEKADIKKYNDLMKQQRKAELPPVYEPLLLNCELLFSLEAQMGRDGAEDDRLQSILHANGEALFLSAPIDAAFGGQADFGKEANVQFDGGRLTISADMLSADSAIRVRVKMPETNETAVFEDWVIEKVVRETEGDIATFAAIFKSATAAKFDWQPGMTITIEIDNGEKYTPVLCQLNVIAEKKLLVFSTVKFEQVSK